MDSSLQVIQSNKLVALALRDCDDMDCNTMAKDQFLKSGRYASANDEAASTSSVIAEIRRYLLELADDFRQEQAPRSDIELESPQVIAEAAFAIISSKKFTHLTRTGSSKYRAAILVSLAEDAKAGRPLRFYYDIGGGYRAGTNDKQRELTFSPALGELFLLRQIKLFDDQIRAVYAPGTKFSLVIDNLCAMLVNDIPVDRTSGYCEELRKIIQQLDMEEKIDLFVESEFFDPEDYDTDTSDTTVSPPSPGAVENVSRFLGRLCDSSEAMERIARYAVVSEQTDRKINSEIDGVRMTQRATPTTFGFRSVPGGDSRMQAGDVILMYCQNGRIKPRLFTSQSKISTQIQKIGVSDLFPLPDAQIGYTIDTK